MAWFLKYYKHKKCNTAWTDEWSCACNDKCRKCGAEIEAYDWDDLSVLVEDNEDGTWTVLVSPMSASDQPDYAATDFKDKEAAENYAATQLEWIEDNWWTWREPGNHPPPP